MFTINKIEDMKYLISIILLSVLIACNSTNSETLLHNEILNGSVSHIYESKHQYVPFDTIGNYHYVVTDSSLKVMNKKGLETSTTIFSFQNNMPFVIRESKVFYKKNIIEYGQDFYPRDNSSLTLIVMEHGAQNQPTLINATVGNKTVGYSRIEYNDKGLAIKNVAFAENGTTQKWQTTTEYNDKNHVERTISTDISTGIPSTTSFEYLSFDEKGNWTSRKEYNSSSNQPSLVYRKYDYYQ